MYLSNNTLLQGSEYKIVRFIHAGGFGNTYEGLDVNLNALLSSPRCYYLLAT